MFSLKLAMLILTASPEQVQLFAVAPMSIQLGKAKLTASATL